MVFGPPVSQRFEKRKEKFVLGSSEIHQIPVLLALCTRMSRPCGVIGHQQGRGLTAPAVPACKAAAASGAQLLSSSQPPAKLTRREDISGRFQYFRIYSLLSFYSQDKKAQLKAGTGPFVFPSPEHHSHFPSPDLIPALLPTLHVPLHVHSLRRRSLQSDHTVQVGAQLPFPCQPVQETGFPPSLSPPSGRPFSGPMGTPGHPGSPS